MRVGGFLGKAGCRRARIEVDFGLTRPWGAQTGEWQAELEGLLPQQPHTFLSRGVTEVVVECGKWKGEAEGEF